DKDNKLSKYNDKKMTLGVRPESFELYKNAAPADNLIDINADLVELLGSERYVHFKIGDDNAVAKFESGCGVHESDKIKVRVITEKIHLFECDTEDEKTIV
ncbi:MAG TPA: hypothetical protein PKL57_08135, partial [Candidatus Wallbacteria bacterium]|nr:hypothetical protein [Candidatus Wallbacteria bacterium]